MIDLPEFLRTLTQRKFWGTVTLKFKDGALAHITKEESFLPDQINPKDRRSNDHTSY